MKLTRKHIGKLFDVRGGDGSWVYQLVDVKKGWLLFYSFHAGEGAYFKERVGEYHDWRPFRPLKDWPENWRNFGWTTARDK